MTTTTAKPAHELVLERVLNATPENCFRAWTEPELIKQWFAPKPWSIARAEVDLRPGGKSFIVMKSPEGQEMPCPGVYLEVVPGRKLVFTDAYTEGWVPSQKPFMTAIVEFEPAPGGKTKYTARARHWDADDLKAHEQMGFHDGWGQCAQQLEEVASKL